MYFLTMEGNLIERPESYGPYGPFITETEVDLLLKKRGWVPTQGFPKKAWVLPGRLPRLFLLLDSTQEDVGSKLIDKEEIPKGAAPAETDDLIGNFYMTHFQTI